MKERKRKLLFVINTMGRGGAEQTLLTLLRRIDPSKYDVDLLVLLSQGELIDRVPSYVHLLNKRYNHTDVLSAEGRKYLLKAVLSDCVRHGSLLRNIPYLLRNTSDMLRRHSFQADKLLWKLVSDASDVPDTMYDLAVAYLEGGSTYFVADHVRARRKIAFLHVDYRKAGYTRSLDHGCYRKMHHIFCVSKDNVHSFLAVWPELRKRTDVFYLSPDPDEVQKKASLPGGFSDEFDGVRILTIARLVHQKHLDLSVDALKLYEERRKSAEGDLPKVRWYVLGDGDERNFLEEKIRTAHLEEKFVLLGVRDNPYPYLRMADLYVHCTGFEGRSIALQEAKILGKPIIASKCSGNREVIDSGRDGLLVSLDPGEIEESVEHLLRNPKEAGRLGDEAGREGADGSSVDRILDFCR